MLDLFPATTLTPGDKVRIIGVVYPNMPEHAKFIGRVGVMRRYIKSRRVVEVVFNDGSRRDAYPCNVEAA